MSEKSRLPEIFPANIPEDELKEIIGKAKDWALMHGACMRSKTSFSTDVLQFAPFILTPSPFPRREFKKATEIQIILNELMHKVSHNFEFLKTSLKSTLEADDFTARLFKIFETVQQEGITQPISLGLIRSDLMLETSCSQNKNCNGSNFYCCWKQVEINTIASGFGWLGPISAAIQRYVLQEMGHSDKLQNLPDNNALQGLCGGMIDAWKLYNDSNAVILFIIEDITYNICDQRFHEFEIRKMNPEVRVIRKTLTEMFEYGCLGPNKELMFENTPIAVVYFRSGYEPTHYPSPKEWEARLMIERSRAIKCPSIQYHLAGTKKVQQALAKPGSLELFLSEPAKIEAVKEIFTGLYSLDFDEYGDLAVQMAMDQPEKFVLKPQREGGGHNVYGTDIRKAIIDMKDSKERLAYILMERINPPVTIGYMIRPGGPEIPKPSELVYELGIFGVIIGDETNIFTNKQVGHMLRTKISTADEGGVAAGLGALDSPYLVD